MRKMSLNQGKDRLKAWRRLNTIGREPGEQQLLIRTKVCNIKYTGEIGWITFQNIFSDSKHLIKTGKVEMIFMDDG